MKPFPPVDGRRLGSSTCQFTLRFHLYADRPETRGVSSSDASSGTRSARARFPFVVHELASERIRVCSLANFTIGHGAERAANWLLSYAIPDDNRTKQWSAANKLPALIDHKPGQLWRHFRQTPFGVSVRLRGISRLELEPIGSHSVQMAGSRWAQLSSSSGSS